MSQELWKSYFNTGLESAKAGMVETAIDYFEWSAKLKQDNQEIFYNLGVSYMTIGKMTDAINAFTKSLKIDDSNSDAYANRAICFSYIDENKKSMKDVKEAVKRGAVEEGSRLMTAISSSFKRRDAPILSGIPTLISRLTRRGTMPGLAISTMCTTKRIGLMPPMRLATRFPSLPTTVTPSSRGPDAPTLSLIAIRISRHTSSAITHGPVTNTT